jgi:hypothetical protein
MSGRERPFWKPQNIEELVNDFIRAHTVVHFSEALLVRG